MGVENRPCQEDRKHRTSGSIGQQTEMLHKRTIRETKLRGHHQQMGDG